MTVLVKYNAACKALAAAKRVDEVKNIRDKAEAMRAYAKQAKNRALEVDAAEIRFRAERRLGQLIQAQKATVGLAKPGPKQKQKIGSSKELNSPTLKEAGIDKKLSSRAQKLAAIPEKKFEKTVAEWRDKVEDETERVTSTLLKQGDKAQARQKREAELAAKQLALPDKKYGVIYADPEWRFEPYSRDTGMDRAADNHYPTSNTEEIAQRDVQSISADDAVLLLWATAPMMPAALQVMEAWGFNYKSQIIWNKDKIGTGYWFRNKHELLLLGTRGNVPAPVMGTQWPSVIDAPVQKHSQKPDVFLEMIEFYFPNLPKIELNRRGPPRQGWDAWGNEYDS